MTLLGVVPTPEVAWWSATRGAPAAMVSASHNPFGDNGIKLFSAGGRKLSDAVEAQLEDELRRLTGATDATADARRPTGAAVGQVAPAAEVHEGYAAAVVSSIEGRRLDGLTAVVDCANGSASTVAPRVLAGLGIDVHVIHAEPDGANINDGCGSTHTEGLARAVVERAPTWGWRSTATPTACCWSTRRASWSTATRSSPCAPSTTRKGRAGRRQRGRHRDDQPGLPPGDGAAGHPGGRDQGGRPYVLEALEAGGLSLGASRAGT